MTILFLSYWGIGDGLSEATVLPHVEILSKDTRVEEIVLVTIERSLYKTPYLPGKVKHVALTSKNHQNVLLTKASDFLSFPTRIVELCRLYNVSLIMSRSVLAGAIAYLVWRKTRIPFTVESFEPHADYMLESRVWRRWDPRYIMQVFFEKKQKKVANFLLPVARGFTEQLLESGVEKVKLITMPCCVDSGRFRYSPSHRLQIREQVNIPEAAIAGIYVGKFGGIYYEREAFEMFRQAETFWQGKFYLIVLTDYDKDLLLAHLVDYGLDPSRIFIESVAHQQVPMYLSASDFAFTFYKLSPSKRFLSPIKIGEYWANGLPVLIGDGIGDDFEIIENEGGGIVYKTPGDVDFNQLSTMLLAGRPALARKIATLAERHRDFKIVSEAYCKIISNIHG